MPVVKKLVIKNDETIRQKVYNHLRAKILDGSVVPLERLVETKLAREIGTSRTPVREALHALEREKLIRSKPRVGYYVEAMNLVEVEEICEIRSVIEGLAARWAMEKSPAKLIKDLAKSIENQEREIEKGNLAGYVEQDAQFHEILARSSGSGRLLELTQTLRQHMLRYRIQCIYKEDTAKRSMEGHKQILQAIKKSDSEEVSKSIRKHLEQAKNDIVHYVFDEKAKDRHIH